MSLAAEGRALRVLFLNDTWRNGGPGRTLFYILKFLDPACVHRAVVLPRDGVIGDLLRGVADQVIFEPGLVENIFEPWHRAMEPKDHTAPLPLRCLLAVGNILRGAAAMIGLLRLVRRERFDAIFCNGTTANFFGGFLAAVTGVPTVWHVFYTGVGSAIAGLHRILSGGANVRRILCVSEPTSRLFGHCRSKVRLLHDAIDIEEFDCSRVTPRLRQEFSLSRDTVIFGSQGRILPRKGYFEMVRAARLAVDEMSQEERRTCRFFVLGETPGDMTPDHLAQCRALVEELKLSSMFFFVGPRVDVKPYVADFDVAVVSSVYEDPLPRSVLESMALGKPVIAFDVGGIGEMVEDGFTGSLVPGRPPDVAALAQEILRYLRSPGLRQRCGQAGRRKVERDFEARRHARVLQDELWDLVRRQ